jgi:tetratricopeptide (TPR) repeat protein
MNRPQENVEEMRKAVALDPQNPVLRVCFGWHRLFAAEYDNAVADADLAVQMAPNLFWSPMVRGWAFEQQGKFAEALAEFDAALTQSGGLSIAAASRAHALALVGEKSETERVARELIERSRTAYVSAFEIAVVFVGLGDLDATFEWLQNAVRERSTWLVHVGWDARFRPARSDPRFPAIMRAIGLPLHSVRTGTDSKPSR